MKRYRVLGLQVKVLSETPKKLSFKASGASVKFLNAMRRCINNELPSFAISAISFYENTSPIFNDYLANRVGLIPLTFEENVADDAKITFELTADASEGETIVYSGGLNSADPVIKVFTERVPIVKLGKGQKLKFEATADKATAKKHARYQCALASYAEASDFEPKKEKNAANASESEACDYVFKVESYNNLSAREHVQRALKILGTQLEEFDKNI